MPAADPTRKRARDPRSGQTAPDVEQSASPALEDEARDLREIGGPSGPDPTRYGDWERKGRCIDF